MGIITSGSVNPGREMVLRLLPCGVRFPAEHLPKGKTTNKNVKMEVAKMREEIEVRECPSGKCIIVELDEGRDGLWRESFLTGRRNGMSYWCGAWWKAKVYTKKTAEKIAAELRRAM